MEELKRWIKSLFCKHKWKLTDEYIAEGTDIVIALGRTCEHCGEHDVFRIPPYSVKKPPTRTPEAL